MWCRWEGKPCNWELTCSVTWTPGLEALLVSELPSIHMGCFGVFMIESDGGRIIYPQALRSASGSGGDGMSGEIYKCDLVYSWVSASLKSTIGYLSSVYYLPAYLPIHVSYAQRPGEDVRYPPLLLSTLSYLRQSLSLNLKLVVLAKLDACS